jgi:hypothetical protein
MFSPEAEAGGEPGGRTAGRDGRPPALVAAVVLFAVFWVSSAGMASWGLLHQLDRPGTAGDLVVALCWTLAVALLLWRVWRGGPKATRMMAYLGATLGTVMLVGMVAFAVLFAAGPFGGAHTARTAVRVIAPGLLAGGALFTSGLLLRRRDVRRWSRR